MSPIAIPPDFLHALDRYRFLMILNAAEECEEHQFIKQASMFWLVNFPGDLYVQYHQALAFANLKNQSQAVSQLEGLVEFDPFFIEPVQALSEIITSDKKNAYYKSLAQFLSMQNPPANASPAWLNPLWNARQAYTQGDYKKATTLIHQSLVENPPSPIPAVFHLKTAHKMANKEMLNNLSEIYYQKWPKCLQINVIKALAEMDQGKESAAVERLHWIAAHDSAGQVIQQLMGSDHRFVNLWPERMEVYFDLPIPASVTAFLGWNQLRSGQTQTPEFKQSNVPSIKDKRITTEATQRINVRESVGSKPKTVETPNNVKVEERVSSEQWATEKDFEEVQAAFTKLAKRLKKPDLERADNRFPVYVILSSKNQLESIYGPNTASVIDESLKKLVSLIQQMPNWGALLFFPDDPVQMAELGLKPTIASDAWQIKLALADLDKALEKRGEMIGSLLIVGGPEIVPYHHLPNPTFDDDLDVPSDNPYSTIDENYFIPQWPVGRLPGETGSDAGLLLSQIRHSIYQYEQKSKQSTSIGNNFASLINWVMRLFADLNRQIDRKKSLGYSAEIWKEASAGVYKTVGKVNDLKLSPPVYSNSLMLNNNHGHSLGYFNLHGVKDGPHWYGQKDFSSDSNGPDYPVALSPTMFTEHVPSPKLVFTEACYGANVHKKQNEEALSLKFLDCGTTSFIGSTCIAYGSVTTPLIAADYLAEMFWRQVKEGQPAGYALMHAKLSLAEEMTRVQGFLDGEDQKTILSFVLFGDPLAVHEGLQAMPKPLFRIKTHPAVRTISDSDMEPYEANSKMPKDVQKSVKKVVEKYLPGLHNAQMHYNKSYGAFVSDQTIEGKATKSVNSERYMVTLQKSYEQNQHTTHHHYARMTFDKKGKLVKFTTSR